MTRAVGPYVEMAGPMVWVPRTVPYLRAREIAQEANQNDDRLVYRGKVNALLLGFVRDCPCEEVCEREYRWDEERADDVATGDRSCYVPAWSFELVER